MGRIAGCCVLLLAAQVVRGDDEAAAGRLPEDAVMRLGSSRLNVPGAVTTVAISPDGKQLACGFANSLASNYGARVWDVASGRRTHSFSGRGAAKLLRFSPDGAALLTATHRIALDGAAEEHRRPSDASQAVAVGETLAAFLTSSEGEMIIAKLETGKEVSRFQIPVKANGFQSADLSPDEKLVAVGTYDGQLQLRQTGTGRLVHDLDLPRKKAVQSIAFSPDGRWLAAAGSLGLIPVYDVRSGEVVKRLATVDPFGTARGDTVVVRFTPDGRRVAAGNGDNGVVQFWERESGRPLRSLQTSMQDVHALAMTPDGELLVVGGDNRFGGQRINVFDVQHNRQLLAPEGPKSRVTQLAYAPNGGQIAAATIGRRIHLWDLTTGEPLVELEGDASGGLAYSPDSWLLGAVDRRGAYQLWETDTGDPLFSRNSDVLSVRSTALSPQMDVVAVGTRRGMIRLMDVASGKEIRAVRASEEGTEVACLAISPDGAALASAGGRASREKSTDAVELWDVKSGERTGRLAVPVVGDALSRTGMEDLQFSPDGRLVAGVHASGTTLLWVVSSGDCIAQLPRESHVCLCFSSDGKMLILVQGEQVKLVEIATNQVLATRSLFRVAKPDDPFAGTSRPSQLFTAAAASPDGQTIATALAQDNTVLVWSLAPEGWSDRAEREPLDDEQFQAFWSRLAENDGPPAYRALWELAARKSATVQRLKSRLRPARAATVDEQQIAKLIEDLDSDEFRTRDDATNALLALGGAVEPHLRKRLKGDASREVKFRISRLLERIKSPVQRFSGESLRRIRAVELLERIGSRDAADLLEKLAAGDADARETQDAQAALGRVRARLKGR